MEKSGRTPSQPLLFLPKPVVRGAPVDATGIPWPASIPSGSSGLTGGRGAQRQRMGSRWGREELGRPFSSPQTPSCAAAVEAAPAAGLRERARRAQPRPGAWWPALRGRSPRLGRPTPRSQHPTLRLGTPTRVCPELPIPHVLCTLRAGPPLLSTPCQNTPTPRASRPWYTPRLISPRRGDSVHPAPRASRPRTGLGSLCPLPRPCAPCAAPAAWGPHADRPGCCAPPPSPVPSALRPWPQAYARGPGGPASGSLGPAFGARPCNTCGEGGTRVGMKHVPGLHGRGQRPDQHHPPGAPSRLI